MPNVLQVSTERRMKILELEEVLNIFIDLGLGKLIKENIIAF